MSELLLLTQLFVPPPRAKIFLRPRFIKRLYEALKPKVILNSIPAGFGKTNQVSEWATGCDQKVAWLLLHDRDNDPAFMKYLIAVLQTIDTNVGKGVLAILEAAKPPPFKPILTNLLNEFTTISDSFILVPDDYHVIDSKPVEKPLPIYSRICQMFPRAMALLNMVSIGWINALSSTIVLGENHEI
jgi:LuxR family maltose regulon positive regulatory protein